MTSIGWVCTYADHKFRGVKCKHIYAVESNFPIREPVLPEIVIQPKNTKYMYAIMDDETRFWIAQQVSGSK